MIRIGATGVLLSTAAPQTPEWHAARRAGVGSSDIAALLGLSPWTSPFDLYWQKVSGEVIKANAAMRWGTRLEPIIRDAWAAMHPEFAVWQTGVCAHVDRPWQRCSPDGLVSDRASQEWDGDPDDWQGEPVAVIECKSDHNRSAWGEPGSDAIPPHYLAQVRWQLDTLGLAVGYVAVTFGAEPVEYVVEANADDAQLMREAARDFLDRIERGDPPDIDAHSATTARLKRLHPDVEDIEVDVPAALVRKCQDATRRMKHWEAREALYKNQIRDRMGTARYGVADGTRLVSRSVSDIKESTYTRRAYTRHSLYFTKAKEATE